MEPLVALTAYVTAAEFGESWPLSVPEGRVIAGIYQGETEGAYQVALAFEDPALVWYALNGVARTAGIGHDIRHIWPLIPRTNPPQRPDLTPLIHLGLNLAEAEGYWTW